MYHTTTRQCSLQFSHHSRRAKQKERHNAKCSAKCSLCIIAIVLTCRSLSGVREWAARAEEHMSFTQELNLEVPVSLQVLFVSLLSKGKAECT